MFKVEAVGSSPRPLEKYDEAGRYFREANEIVDGKFNDLGIAVLSKDVRLTHLGSTRVTNHRIKLWAEAILSLDPKATRLRLTREGLIQGFIKDDPDKEPVVAIKPTDTRSVIEKETGKVFVSEGGFVLPPPNWEEGYQSPVTTGKISSEELLDLIYKAEKGQVPANARINDKFGIPRVRLAVGTQLEMVTLNGWTWMYSDRVVINPDTKQLVEREMVFPFAGEA